MAEVVHVLLLILLATGIISAIVLVATIMVIGIASAVRSFRKAKETINWVEMRKYMEGDAEATQKLYDKQRDDRIMNAVKEALRESETGPEGDGTIRH